MGTGKRGSSPAAESSNLEGGGDRHSALAQAPATGRVSLHVQLQSA